MNSTTRGADLEAEREIAKCLVIQLEPTWLDCLLFYANLNYQQLNEQNKSANQYFKTSSLDQVQPECEKNMLIETIINTGMNKIKFYKCKPSLQVLIKFTKSHMD